MERILQEGRTGLSTKTSREGDTLPPPEPEREEEKPMENDLLTVKEACELLRVSRNTLYDWIHKGQLHPLRAGRAYRIERRELERILHSSEEEEPQA